MVWPELLESAAMNASISSFGLEVENAGLVTDELAADWSAQTIASIAIEARADPATSNSNIGTSDRRIVLLLLARIGPMHYRQEITQIGFAGTAVRFQLRRVPRTRRPSLVT
jgi:hypothetical protein